MLIYLDNANYSYPKPSIVTDSIAYAMINFVNPLEGDYSLSIKATEALEETRESIAKFFSKSNKDNFIFTPGNSYSLEAVLNNIKLKEGDVIITSEIEPDYILSALENLTKKNSLKLEYLKYLKDKVVNIEELEGKIENSNVKLLVLSHASSITGELAPIRKILPLIKEKNIKLLLNGSHTAGVFPIDLNEIDADYFYFDFNKSILGPAGVSCLYIKDKDSLMLPGELPYCLENGNYNLPAIWAANSSIIYLTSKGFENIYRHHKEMARSVIETISRIDNVKCLSSQKNNVGIISFILENKHARKVARKLDRDYNICISSGDLKSVRALEKLNPDSKEILRIGFSLLNTKEELSIFIKALREISETKG